MGAHCGLLCELDRLYLPSISNNSVHLTKRCDCRSVLLCSVCRVTFGGRARLQELLNVPALRSKVLDFLGPDLACVLMHLHADNHTVVERLRLQSQMAHSRAATTTREVALEHEEVALDSIESRAAVWAPVPANAGQSHKTPSHIQRSPLAGQPRLNAALCHVGCRCHGG